MAGSPTALAKLGVGTGDPVDTALNFSSFDPNVTKELTNNNGTRGTFFLDANRMIENRTVVNPRFSSEPTAPELAYILEWLMGGTPTGTTTKTYPWSDTPAARNVHFKPNVGEEWFLGGVAIDNFTLQAATGGALGIDLDMVGQTADDTRTNFPGTLAYDQTLQPFILAHLALTVGGVDRKPRDINFTINGGIDRERFLNSRTLTTLMRLSASFTVSFEVPSGDNAAGFWKAGLASVAATAIFTNPSTGAVLTLTFPALKWAPASPTWAPGSEGFARINATATRVGSGSPVTISLAVGA